MSVRLKAVGDIFLQTAGGTDDPFALVGDVLADADVVFGNLETSLTDETSPSAQQSVLLRTPPAHVAFLRDAGFTVVNLAHNHARDFGDQGGIDTLHCVRGAGIQTIGAGESTDECLDEAVVEVGETRVAFVGFFTGGEAFSSRVFHVAGMNPQLVCYRIASLARTADHVVVSLHWGRENVFYPAPEQQSFARRCIDAGASVVLGHHAHFVQGIERYGDGLVFYSLGNFNFWQFDVRPRPYHRVSCIADVVLDGSGVRYDLIPVTLDDDYRPRIVPDQRRALEEHVSRISEPLFPAIDKWWWFGEIAVPYLLDSGRSFAIKIRRYGIGQVPRMLRWLTSRFVIKCYIGLARRYLWPRR